MGDVSGRKDEVDKVVGQYETLHEKLLAAMVTLGKSLL